MAEPTKVVCQFCRLGSEIEEVAGKLHAGKTEKGKVIAAHHRCMQYASALVQYKMEEFGGFDIDEVEQEIKRGLKLRCALCKSSHQKKSNHQASDFDKEKARTKAKGMGIGAASGCAVSSCRKSFHYPCAVRDPNTITKRLVVTTNKNSDSKEKFVYYRVFCSKEHEMSFREFLKEELREGKTKRKRGPKKKQAEDSNQEESQDEESQEDGEDSQETGEEGGEDDDGASGHSTASTAPGHEGSPEAVEAVNSSDVVVKTLSPGQKLLLSFAGNLKEQDAAEAVTSGLLRKVKPSQPLQVMGESKRGAANATVVVHATVHQRHAQGQPDEDSVEAEVFATPTGRPTRNSSRAATQTNETPSLSEGVCEASASPTQRSPRKTPSALNTLDKSRGNSTLNVATPEVASLNVSLATPPTRMLRPREVPQNGFTDISLLLETPSQSDGAQDSPRSTRSSRSRASEQRKNDPSHAQSSGAKAGEDTDDGDVIILESGDNEARKSRKRKADDKEGAAGAVSEVKASRGGDAQSVTVRGADTTTTTKPVSDVAESLASVLLLPTSVGGYKQNEQRLTKMAAEALGAELRHVCVWQEIVTKFLPSDLMTFFLVDIITQLRMNASEELLRLLFDEDHRAARENDYHVQSDLFRALGDVKAKTALCASLWDGMEKKMSMVPCVRLLRLPNHDFVTLAIDLRLCRQSLKVQSYVQAHKGLSWWDTDVEVSQVTKNAKLRDLAAQAEAWIWQVWVTKVCPVSEMHILPIDHYLHHKGLIADRPHWITLLQSLKEGVRSPKGGRGLLLVFQLVDTSVVQFSNYFRKACLDHLRTRPSGCMLALVPLDNLQEKTHAAVADLMGCDGQFTVSIRSAFSLDVQMTTMVLLEIVTNH